MPPAAESSNVTVLDALVFVDELVLLVVVAIAGASIDAPIPARVALAVVLVAAVGLVWGRWLAPRAPHPIRYPQRVAAKLVVFAVGAITFAVSGRLVGAIGFFAVSAALVVASERQRDRAVR